MNPQKNGYTTTRRSIDGIRATPLTSSSLPRPLATRPRPLERPVQRIHTNRPTQATPPQQPFQNQMPIPAAIRTHHRHSTTAPPSLRPSDPPENINLSLNLDLPPIGTRRVVHKPKAAKLSSRLPQSIYFGGVMSCFVAVVIGGATMLNAFIFQSYYVEGLSMQPTLQDDDRLIVSKVERTAAGVAGGNYLPKRGQIVVIDSDVSELTKSRNEQIIKRVVGLPGDTVQIFDGKVIISNSERPEGFNIDRSLDLNVSPTFVKGAFSVYIPEGKVFVLGDNRTEGGSFDSRSFGPLDADLIKGRLAVRVLPFSGVSVF